MNSPNNRLMKRENAFGYIRPIREDDIHLPELKAGVDEVDTAFGELLYENKARQSSVYLYVYHQNVCGYVCFNMDGNRILLNTLASSKDYQGQGIGTALVRWAETFARSCRCEAIELWAIDNKIEFYVKMGFVTVVERTIKYNESTSFTYMRRKILYNTKEHSMNTF